MPTKTVEEMKDVYLKRYVTKEDYHNASVGLDGILFAHDAQIRSKAIEIIDNAISNPAERQLAKDMLNDLV